MKHSVFLNHNEIEILNRLPETQFKNFCFTFFASLGLTNIESIPVAECECVAGKGTIELGILSYHFVFLGKQHVGTVDDNIIQKIRDTMDSKTNKGLVLTTGYFTREAKRQAKIKGKPPIDLIDRSNLIERLKKYNLKISIEIGEVVQIDKEQKL
jgi:restriction system protein